MRPIKLSAPGASGAVRSQLNRVCWIDREKGIKAVELIQRQSFQQGSSGPLAGNGAASDADRLERSIR
jgi:hypothetical protein